MWLVGMLVGSVLGASIGHDMWLPGAAAGAFLGWLIARKPADPDARLKELSERINKLAVELADLRGRFYALEKNAAATPDHASPDASSESVDSAFIAQDFHALPSANIAPEKSFPIPDPSAAAPVVAAPPRVFTESPAAVRAAAPPNPVIQWLLGGNTVVRVGVVILFFGVAFLLKYAYEHSHVPISVRLTGVAVGAITLLVIGWRLRERRAGYALTLQGGAIGVLYLNIFAAFRLYDLIPATPAFVMLVIIVGISALLAILQDSLALAAFGVSGGFLAPLLTSTGQGSHVMLFSYYLILNLGILAISWHKAWRMLNLLGFGFTFVIGAIWGAKFYGPEFFVSTEPFLVVFFLLYVAIPILFARRQSDDAKPYVDATLTFGIPLVAFGLQSGLVKSFEYGAAWSALAAAAFYILLAAMLWRATGTRLRLLSESFLALGIVFATLTIPLAFDGRLTSAAWALEGAAIVWIGIRQQRLLARSFGLALQILAGIAFLGEVDKGAGTTPVFNGFFLGCAFIAIGGLFCSAYLERQREKTKRWEQTVSGLLLAWGALWWAAGGLHEIDRHVLVAFRPTAALLFLVVSAAVFSVLSSALSWRRARWPAYAILPVGMVFAAQDFFDPTQPSAQLGFLAWPATFALHLWVLRREQGNDNDAKLHYWLHAAGFWLFAFIASCELSWQIDQAVAGKPVWPLIAWAIIPATLLMLVTSGRGRKAWPASTHTASYLLAGGVPLAIFLGAWTVFANFTSTGDPAPLPYVPLLNPLDLAQGLVFLSLGYWIMTIRKLGLGGIGNKTLPIYALFGAAAFIWINGILLRTLHHWAAVPFDLDTMLKSVLVQAAFSLLWTLLALVMMVTATRRAWRKLWIAGAVLMAVVVAKLFMVDLSDVGGIERIVSFIGVGILMLVVGYFSPVPPNSITQEQPDAR